MSGKATKKPLCNLSKIQLEFQILGAQRLLCEKIKKKKKTHKNGKIFLDFPSDFLDLC